MRTRSGIFLSAVAKTVHCDRRIVKTGQRQSLMNPHFLGAAQVDLAYTLAPNRNMSARQESTCAHV